MKFLSGQWDKIRVQLQGNPRLKWALALIAVLLVGMAWQALDHLRVSSQKQAIADEVNRRRIRSLQGQDIWFSHASSAKALRESLWAELPEVATPGQAQAALQSWLRTLTAPITDEKNALRVSVESSSPVKNLPGALKVNATISGGLSARQVLNLVRQIESATNLVVIETIQIQSDLNNNFSMTINAYYRIPHQEPKK